MSNLDLVDELLRDVKLIQDLELRIKIVEEHSNTTDSVALLAISTAVLAIKALEGK